MKNLVQYITEKLKINKETNSNKSFDKIKSLIKDWLEDHSWFDLDEDQFNIKVLKDGGISLEFPSNSNPSKKQILLQAVKDLNGEVESNITLYQLQHRLEKLLSN